MRTLWLLLPALMIGGCQTEATSARFASAQADALTCQQRVLSYKETMARNQPTLKGQDLLLYMVVAKALDSRTADELASCDDMFIAMTNADSVKTSKLIDRGFGLAGIGLGIWGVSIVTNGITDLANGGVNGDTFNISGSRVNSKSGNVSGGGTSTVSSSGDGLGLGNTFSTGSGQSVGGIQPRTTPINGDVTTLETGSNSGTNEPVTTSPEQLPAPE